MKKTIRLTESELIKLVKKIINEQQPKTAPTSQNPLCNSKTGTAGSGSETEYKVCVWKDQFATYIKLVDNKGQVLVQVYAQDFNTVLKQFFDKVAKDLQGKKIGVDLPMPINPDL